MSEQAYVRPDNLPLWVNSQQDANLYGRVQAYCIMSSTPENDKVAILSSKDACEGFASVVLQQPTVPLKKLKDGIPTLRQTFSLSPPSVPPGSKHKPCERTEENFPFLLPVPENVLNAPSPLERDEYVYCSESDIAYIVRQFLEKIVYVLGFNLSFNAEVTIKQIRPDICVLTLGIYLVGVVEVKKPGNNVLLEPTVLGELMDQMLLVEGFYGMGPAIGILTTAEEWIFSWFPADSTALAPVDLPEASFTTPMKQKSSSVSIEANAYSPPGGTPSQTSGIIHFIDEMVDASLAIDDEVTQELDRLLCVTPVLNIFSDPVCVLQHLCSAFHIMSKASLHHYSHFPRCLLKFHKDIFAVTFHPMSYQEVQEHVDYNLYPNKNVKTLIALEDLGRGSTGKAWLCVTVTQSRSAACVLKFDNVDTRSERLRKEEEMWRILYPEFANMVKIEFWSGAEALVMPHFSTVLHSERELYRDELFHVLTSHFMDKGKVHTDVRWRNIGKYRDKSGAVVLVVYDLYGVIDYDLNLHHDWIEKAMLSLFGDSETKSRAKTQK